VDLNFGCPSPTVNGSDGGATLLKYPDRIRAIVAAVRAAVPTHLPVSAKLRLGWDDMTQIHVNADRAVEGGASWITIHGRTKMQGYTPPAYWGPIGEVVARLPVPVIANGEIWTLDDFKRCRDETHAEHYMIGRGALADPTLQTEIARELGLPHAPLYAGAQAATNPSANAQNPAQDPTRVWPEAIDRFAGICAPYYPEVFVIKRTKQWLSFARKGKGAIGLEGQRLFDGTKRLNTMSDILEFVRTPV
jgi:tRNA-dihydrouridine synthase